jgi:lincosamide nucleotidyltransferase A/C/D/E
LRPPSHDRNDAGRGRPPVLDALEAYSIPVVIDGGWGIDALVGVRTRDHDDLDLVIERDRTEITHAVLAKLGFVQDKEASPGLPARLALKDERDRRVDLHILVFDEQGNGWQEQEGGDRLLYPGKDLSTTGTIGERQVRCISADLQLQHHLGHPESETVLHSLGLLQSLGVAVPRSRGQRHTSGKGD